MNGDLSLSPPRTLEEFGAGIRRIASFHKQFRWRLGEYLVKGEQRFGEQIWQHIGDLGFHPQDIDNMMSVYRRIGEQYTPELKWGIWQALAPLEPSEREPFIKQGLTAGVTRDEIRLFAASRNGNGAVHAPQPENAPTALEMQLRILGSALVAAGRLVAKKLEGAHCDVALAQAMDELWAEWMKIDSQG